jgi:predicted NUDIX family phosphoesterase
MKKQTTSRPEKVLAVQSVSIWSRIPYVNKGLITEGTDQISGLVARRGEFIERADAEGNPEYKQIIPYAVIRKPGGYFFLLQRKSTQSEQRLHNKFSIGVGGHINPSDATYGRDPIRTGLAREVSEELHIAAGYGAHLVGLINDDTTEVGRVHLGVLFEISAPHDVSVRETKKMEGAWAHTDHVIQIYERLETWSQIVFDSHLAAETECG